MSLWLRPQCGIGGQMGGQRMTTLAGRQFQVGRAIRCRGRRGTTGHRRKLRRRDTNTSPIVRRDARGSDRRVRRSLRPSDWLAWGMLLVTVLLVIVGGILTM